MCSMIDPGEKGYMLPEQILFNSLVLYLTQNTITDLGCFVFQCILFYCLSFSL